jgi:hypothetical protein
MTQRLRTYGVLRACGVASSGFGEREFNSIFRVSAEGFEPPTRDCKSRHSVVISIASLRGAPDMRPR